MNLTKDIEKLCREVSQEQDGDKLLSLVDQLNKQLADMAETPASAGAVRQPTPEVQPEAENKPNAA